MGDFVYNGEHSISIGDKNTWKTWHMAPKTRPFVAAPTPKTEYVDVPGADGSLDYTEALSDAVRYGNRIGSWEFIVDNDKSYPAWYELYSELLMNLHGQYFERIILDDDPNYYWSGRLTISGNFGNKDYSSISIGYTLDPYKKPISYTDTKMWMWNDLFNLTIDYGIFSVNGKKARNIINNKNEKTNCIINVTRQMTVYDYKYDGDRYDMLVHVFENGKHKDPKWILSPGNNLVELEPGNNFLYFVGVGLVKVSYEQGGLL